MPATDVQNFVGKIQQDSTFRQSFLKEIFGLKLDPNNSRTGDAVANFARQNGFNLNDDDTKQVYNVLVKDSTNAISAELSELELEGVAGGAASKYYSSMPPEPKIGPVREDGTF